MSIKVFSQKYLENSYNIVERKRGRPTMQKKPKKVKNNDYNYDRIKEKLKELSPVNYILQSSN